MLTQQNRKRPHVTSHHPTPRNDKQQSRKGHNAAVGAALQNALEEGGGQQTCFTNPGREYDTVGRDKDGDAGLQGCREIELDEDFGAGAQSTLGLAAAEHVEAGHAGKVDVVALHLSQSRRENARQILAIGTVNNTGMVVQVGGVDACEELIVIHLLQRVTLVRTDEQRPTLTLLQGKALLGAIGDKLPDVCLAHTSE
jgi:hypothetical protein